MKILFYMIISKMIFLFLIYLGFFAKSSYVKLDNGMDENDFLLFKTFVIDHAVTGM